MRSGGKLKSLLIAVGAALSPLLLGGAVFYAAAFHIDWLMGACMLVFGGIVVFSCIEIGSLVYDLRERR